MPSYQTLAQHDSGRMEKYKPMIKRVGGRYQIEPSLIAAIISRESAAGYTLKNGWGDDGKAWGLMQVDVTPNGGNHTPRGDWDSEEHLNQATEILVYFIGRISTKFPTWSRAQNLRGWFHWIRNSRHNFLLCFSFVFVFTGGIAAYNMGDGNVHSYDGVDANTHGGDYSKDVLARAQWYKNNGY
ncbi:lysozyme g-like isoform X1 [Trematomus bernacchii]|uniref:lysozyme g-like isoform X1 n=1 Tax=Trematomus bernacchii TaxID=40690 RepID=UPI00146E3DCD|nr:lysozyme g-like isoform X1 [Trematomus bernacchii]XP_033985995.1 lysozyme g-like isoform X1 [Trematomus bernacchii]